MLEKGKITAFQMGVIMYPTILATAVLIVPAISAKFARNDLWLSPLLASLSGFLTMALAYQLHRRFPKQSVIQYGEKIAGRAAGKAIGLLFLLFYLHTNGLIVRQYADFVSSAFMPNTPMIVISASLVAVVSLSVRSGIEGVARSSFFCSLLFAGAAVILLPLIPDLDAKNILPIMEHGILPAIRGMIVPQSWFCEFFLISFLLPYVSNAKDGLKWGTWSVIAVTMALVYTNLFILFLYGERVQDLIYPMLTATRYIRIGGFIENFESIVMMIWVLGNFVKISVFHYAVSIGFAQWLRLTDFKALVFPIGVLVVLSSIWSLPDFQLVGFYISNTFPIYATIIQAGIPALLYLIALMRGQAPVRATQS